MRARFRIPDLPADRPKVPDVVELIKKFISIEGNAAGGILHVIIDDGNIDRTTIAAITVECIEKKEFDASIICRKLMQMTPTQRGKVISKI